MVRRSRLEDNFARRRVVVQQTVPLPRLPQTWLSLPEQSRSLIPIMDFTFVVNQIVSDETGIAMDAFENITVLQDSDNPLIGPALEGEDGVPLTVEGGGSGESPC